MAIASAMARHGRDLDRAGAPTMTARRISAGLRARIVVGDDHDVGMLGGGGPSTALAWIAIAAGAEDDDEPAGGQRAQGRERAHQCIGLLA